MVKIADLSEQIKGKSGSVNFINFGGTLGFLKNIRDGYTTPKNAEKN